MSRRSRWDAFKPVLQPLPEPPPPPPPLQLPSYREPRLPSEARLAPPELLPVPPAPPPFRDAPVPPFALPAPPEDEPFDAPALRLPPPPAVREAPRLPVVGHPAHGHDWTGERPVKVGRRCFACTEWHKNVRARTSKAAFVHMSPLPASLQAPRPALIPPKLPPQPPDPESLQPPSAAQSLPAAEQMELELTPVEVLSWQDGDGALEASSSVPGQHHSGASATALEAPEQQSQLRRGPATDEAPAHKSIGSETDAAAEYAEAGVLEDEGDGLCGDEDPGPFHLVPSAVLAASRPLSAAAGLRPVSGAAARQKGSGSRGTSAASSTSASRAPSRPLSHLISRDLQQQWSHVRHTAAAPPGAAAAQRPGSAAGPAPRADAGAPVVWLSFAAPFADPPPVTLPPRPEAGPAPEYVEPVVEPEPAPFVAPPEEVRSRHAQCAAIPAPVCQLLHGPRYLERV